MYHISSRHKLTRLQTLFAWLKSSVCFEQRWPKSWGAFTTHIAQFNSNFESASRMACFPDSEDDLGNLQQQLQNHICLRETIRRIRRRLAANDVYQTVVHELMDFFHADWIFLLENGPYCWQPVTQVLHLLSADHSTVLNRYLELDVVATKLDQSCPIAINQESVQEVPVDQQWLSQFPGSWLLVPIHLPHGELGDEGPWGLVAIGCKDQTNVWSLEQQDQATILVDEIAIALDHSQRYETLKQDNQDLRALALTDSLTGLANRRQFDTYFDTEWQRLAREKQPLTLILCDIDYFKRYNDYYGHPTGDMCLAQVSQVLTRCIRRPADLVARYGGEEFAVVLPNTDTAGGHSVAQFIQKELAAAAIPHATSGVSDAVTLTMGIATVIPEYHLDSHDLLQAADLALYHAKQQGRDRIYVHAHYCIRSDEDTDGDQTELTQSGSMPVNE